MNARRMRLSALLGVLVLVAGSGASLASARDQAQREANPPSAPKTVEQASQQLAGLQRQADAARYELDQLEVAIKLVEAREAELREGRRVALVGENRTVFMDRAAFNRSLLRHVTQSIIDEAASKGDAGALGLAADADLLKEMVRTLERDALRESENYRQWLMLDLAGFSRRENVVRTREWRLQSEIERLAEQRDRLEAEQAAREGRAPAVRNPADVSSYPAGLSNGKAFFGGKLEELRKAGNWSADHHFQVGTLIGVAKTLNELYSAARMMYEYAACYDTKNLRRAAVLANARTGMYTPGERIAELDKITAEFNTCIGKAVSDFQKARGR